MGRAECARESYKCVITVDSGSETDPASSDATAYFKWGFPHLVQSKQCPVKQMTAKSLKVLHKPKMMTVFQY